MSFRALFDFEQALADYTGSPYVVLTDGCTHAIELCMRYDQVKQTKFSAFTYLSVPMLMHHLNIEYELVDEKWIGEYSFTELESGIRHEDLNATCIDPGKCSA